MEEEVLQFLHDVRSVLRCHQTGSIGEYPVSPELSSFLTISARQKKSISAAVRPTSLTPKPEAVKIEAVPAKSDHKVLSEIKEEVAQCTSCDLAKQRKCTVYGSGGGTKIRLMLIGHWLVESEEMLSGSCDDVFGNKEDQMVSRMLAAINLAPEEVLVTNVIKCSIGSEVQPQAAHIDSCSSYLQRQIKAAKPEFICSMGMVATRALLQLSHPLSRLRGRFHAYKTLSGEEIPLLPTFHPTYLLQNPEMKKATWEDLQALAKRISVK